MTDPGRTEHVDPILTDDELDIVAKAEHERDEHGADPVCGLLDDSGPGLLADKIG